MFSETFHLSLAFCRDFLYWISSFFVVKPTELLSSGCQSSLSSWSVLWQSLYWLYPGRWACWPGALPRAGTSSLPPGKGSKLHAWVPFQFPPSGTEDEPSTTFPHLHQLALLIFLPLHSLLWVSSNLHPFPFYFIRLLLCPACSRVRLLRVKSYIFSNNSIILRLQSTWPSQSRGSPFSVMSVVSSSSLSWSSALFFPFLFRSWSTVFADAKHYRWSCFAQRVSWWGLSLCDSLHGQEK